MKSWGKIKAKTLLFAEEKLRQALKRMAPIDRTFYRNSMRVSFALIGSACMLVYFTWGHVNAAYAITWLAVHCLIVSWQMIYFSQYIHRTPENLVAYDMKLWQWLRLNFLLNGFVWMAGILILYVPDSISHQLMMFTVLLMLISGGSIATMALCPYMFLSFAIPSTVPFFIYALQQGSDIHYFLVATLAASILYNSNMGRSTNLALMKTREERQRSQQLAEELAEQKQVAEEASRAKSAFLAAASHDLRQPVHAMGLYAEHLRSGVDDSLNVTVDGIQSSVDLMQGLLGSLLDISKLDAGVIKPEVSDFPLQNIINSIEQSLIPVAVGKGIRLRMRPSHAYVRSDPTLLHSILSNLVSNAVKYTKSGKVLVGCRIRNDMVCMEVWDSGPGIPEQERENIFREFYQLKQDRKGGMHGMGLGLAIVSRLGQLLGHAIRLKSDTGRGSCFSVELPMAAQASIAPVFINQPWLAATEFAGRTVLVIDNDRNILTSLGHLLNTWGCHVVLATSGTEGLAALGHAEIPDVVITDWNLDNGENGLDIIQVMRGRFGASLRCLLITGETGHQTLIDIQALDIKILNKPVPPARLRRTLAEALVSITPAVI